MHLTDTPVAIPTQMIPQTFHEKNCAVGDCDFTMALLRYLRMVILLTRQANPFICKTPLPTEVFSASALALFLEVRYAGGEVVLRVGHGEHAQSPEVAGGD